MTFQTPDTPLCQRFGAVYGHLPPAQDNNAEISIEWHINKSPTAPAPPLNTPVISEDGLVGYYGTDSLVYIRMPKYGLIAVDLANNRLTGAVTPNCLNVYGAFEDVMMISLAPLYRRRGWFPLHAFAGLSPNGKAALITGEMGAGKTTTGLALLSAGWKLLSNDSPLLTIKDDEVQVLAYPGRLSAFDDSLARFEHLQRFIKTKAQGQHKRIFRAEEAFDDPWATIGTAGGVFFPQVVPGLAHSELIEVAPTEAVLQLMPQAIEGWDKAAIAQNLHLLGKLAEQVPSYILKLAPNVEQLPVLIAEGLEHRI